VRRARAQWSSRFGRAVGAWRSDHLIRIRHKKEAPTPFRGMSRPKFASVGRMGDDTSTAWQCQTQAQLHRTLIFREVTASTEMLICRALILKQNSGGSLQTPYRILYMQHGLRHFLFLVCP
jgi:hypothetical protein